MRGFDFLLGVVAGLIFVSILDEVSAESYQRGYINAITTGGFQNDIEQDNRDIRGEGEEGSSS